jgi:hypothetical protein
MPMKIFLPLALLFLFLISSPVAAQEQMMAERNKMFTISYGLSNAHIKLITPYAGNSLGTIRSTYKYQYTNPLSLTFEYAFRNQVNIGVNVSYFSYYLQEHQIYLTDTNDYTLKGNAFKIQIRSLRYLVHRTKFMFYLFGQAGIRSAASKFNLGSNTQSGSSNLSKFSFLYQSQVRESLELGVGMKFLLRRSIGLSIETGVISSFVQAGIFYRLLEPSRKTKDVYGW